MKFLSILLLAMLLTACALAPPGTREGFKAGPGDAAETIPPPPGTSRAVIALLAEARAAIEAGDTVVAETKLERALRIEPRNPVLWHYMARLRLVQNRPRQAAGLAARSNSLDRTGDRHLQAGNWRLIAEARDRLGDREGARRAEAEAERLEAEY